MQSFCKEYLSRIVLLMGCIWETVSKSPQPVELSIDTYFSECCHRYLVTIMIARSIFLAVISECCYTVLIAFVLGSLHRKSGGGDACAVDKKKVGRGESPGNGRSP